MAKLNRRTIPFGTYNAGVYTLPAIDMGQRTTRYEIAIDRTALPDTPDILVRITLEGSDDGGFNWREMPGSPGSVAGGVVIDPRGNVATESTFGGNFDNSAPASFLMRGTIELTRQLTTAARLTVY